MGQGSYAGAVAMRALSFKLRTQQMRSYAECIACIVTAPLGSVHLLNSVGPAAVTYVPTTM